MNYHLMIFIGLIIGSCVLRRSDAVSSSQLKDEYWGPGEQPSNIDESVRPFKIAFDKQMVDDLKMRLKNARMPQPTMENQDWVYGTHSDFMPVVVDYWLNKYDFQKREDRLNQYPQFLTNIQGLDIHFVHVKPQLSNDTNIEVIPLFMEHGWQGSFAEFYQMIPLLTTVHPNRDFVFELIIASLPGFGYSSGPARPGLANVEVAHIMRNLMLRLGFTKWYVHGTDWGGLVASHLGTLYPEHILGIHSTYCVEFKTSSYVTEALRQLPSFLFNWKKAKTFVKYALWLFQESGFIFIQGTKPDTIGYALSDSPTGLAAYFIEKFVGSTRKTETGFGNGTTLLEEQSMDDILDIIMLYWAPNKATSAMRHHAEFVTQRNFMNTTRTAKVTVPSACTQFPFELVKLPERLIRKRFVNMVSFTKQPRGGHFAPMEEPQLLADDIWAAIAKMREQMRNKKKCKIFC